MNTLGDDFPKEQARIRECIVRGKEIGPAGYFYCAMAGELLKRADKAVMEQDLPEMIRVYQLMKEFKS